MLDNLETNAVLVDGGQEVPVTASFASNYSIWIKLLKKSNLSSHENLTLILQLNGKPFKINPCKVIQSTSQGNDTFRLVFQRDVYSASHLLIKNQPLKLQSAFNELPEFLSRKNLVERNFKEFVSNLQYDLSVYRRLFEDLDIILDSEPNETKKILQEALIKTEGKCFTNFFHSKVKELDDIVKNYNRKEHQIHGSYFRNQLRSFILCCPLMARTNLKPRGYSGDSKMMQMIYQNDYQGESTFSKLLHKYTVSTSAARSVRNRRIIIQERINKLKDKVKFQPKKEIRILSVACGPAWELKKILQTDFDFKNLHFTLLDNDQLALNEASEIVNGIENEFGKKAHVDYLKGSVRTMIANKKFRKEIGKFNFIYSLGLFDYLNKPVAKRVMDFLSQQLLPDGELIVGNFHVSNTSRNFMEYWGDWYLIHRTENELWNLIKESEFKSSSIIYENSKNQIFLIARK